MPNGADKKLNFTLKVYDKVSQKYRPVYIAPDGTDTVQGDVKLSDSTQSILDAASGMTAATPAAVKAVQDNANNKLDKISSSDQTVSSKVIFNNSVTINKGVTVPSGYYFNGNLQGNATTATTLANFRQISVKIGSASAGTANFNGGADASITIPQVDASVVTTGVLPLSVLPQGALERLVKVENQDARFKLTTDDVQLGDSVLQLDTNVMYIVIDTSHLSDESGYQSYSAGTSVSSERVENSLTVMKGESLQFTYDGSVARTLDIGNALTADALTTARVITLDGDITGNVGFDGSQDAIINTSIAPSAVTTDKLADTIGLVSVGVTEPEDNHVQFWIKTNE